MKNWSEEKWVWVGVIGVAVLAFLALLLAVLVSNEMGLNG